MWIIWLKEIKVKKWCDRHQYAISLATVVRPIAVRVRAHAVADEGMPVV